MAWCSGAQRGSSCICCRVYDSIVHLRFDHALSGLSGLLQTLIQAQPLSSRGEWYWDL